MATQKGPFVNIRLPRECLTLFDMGVLHHDLLYHFIYGSIQPNNTPIPKMGVLKHEQSFLGYR